MRTYLLSIIVAALVLYAWRDWFKALCGLIVLTAVVEHPSMPKSVAGIQGFNPWNVLFLSVVAAWLVYRRRERLKWDMPGWMNILLLSYLLVLLVSFGRLLLDRTNLEGVSTARLVSEYLINALKWLVPGLLLFDGCRTRRRAAWTVVCVAALYVLLAAQVVRCTSVSALLGKGDINASRDRIQKRTGYNAVDLAAMLAGASWGLLAMMPIAQRRWQRGLIVASALGVVVAQGLTGGRMGYVAWGAVGLTMCALRWRRYLLLAPVLPVVLALAFPGAAQRMLEGFGQAGLSGEAVANQYQVTSGRIQVWPHVLDQIQEGPIVGFGQLAMIRTGLRERLPHGLGTSFGHPHNAYLEIWLDSGLIGLLTVLIFYGTVAVLAGRLFCDQQNPWCSAVGGIALALVLAQLVASMGAQHFYPREGVVGMWVATGLMLRVWVLRARARVRRRSSAARNAPIHQQRRLAVGY